MVLFHIEHLLNLTSTGTACVSISAFTSLIGIPIDIGSSVVELNIFPVTGGIKKNYPIIKIKRKIHDEIVFLAKTKLNSIEGLNSRDLIDLCISHNEFVSKNNFLKENDDMKEESKI